MAETKLFLGDQWHLYDPSWFGLSSFGPPSALAGSIFSIRRRGPAQRGPGRDRISRRGGLQASTKLTRGPMVSPGGWRPPGPPS